MADAALIADAALLSPAHLMTLGLFLFGMDSAAYSEFSRRTAWRHEANDRFMARAAFQFTGPGEETVTIAGLIVPEVAGSYGAIDTLKEMADAGASYALMDGTGRVLGLYVIEGIEEVFGTIMAGGIPRSIGFTLALKRTG